MLDPAWEKIAEALVNAPDLVQFLGDLNDAKLSDTYEI